MYYTWIKTDNQEKLHEFIVKMIRFFLEKNKRNGRLKSGRFS